MRMAAQGQGKPELFKILESMYDALLHGDLDCNGTLPHYPFPHWGHDDPQMSPDGKASERSILLRPMLSQAAGNTPPPISQISPKKCGGHVGQGDGAEVYEVYYSRRDPLWDMRPVLAASSSTKHTPHARGGVHKSQPHGKARESLGTLRMGEGTSLDNWCPSSMRANTNSTRPSRKRKSKAQQCP